MWAQLITMRLKPGREGDVATFLDHLRDAEQPGSGLIRTTAFADQKDPLRVFVMPVFESEEKARARESDPRRTEALAPMRDMMADFLDGPPEFVDLIVLKEVTK